MQRLTHVGFIIYFFFIFVNIAFLSLFINSRRGVIKSQKDSCCTFLSAEILLLEQTPDKLLSHRIQTISVCKTSLCWVLGLRNTQCASFGCFISLQSFALQIFVFILWDSSITHSLYLCFFLLFHHFLSCSGLSCRMLCVKSVYFCVVRTGFTF